MVQLIAIQTHLQSAWNNTYKRVWWWVQGLWPDSANDAKGVCSLISVQQSLWLFSLSNTFAPFRSMTWLALAIWSVFAIFSNIYRPLFTTSNQSSGKQSKSRDITRSRSQSEDGSRWEPKLSQQVNNEKEFSLWNNVICYPDKPIQWMLCIVASVIRLASAHLITVNSRYLEFQGTH